MTYTISVNSDIRDKFLWFVNHFPGEIAILDESDDEVIPESGYNELREDALSDYRAGNSVSLDTFRQQFAHELHR